MVTIRSSSTVVPPHRYSKEELASVGSAWLSGHEEDRETFIRFLNGSRIGFRHFALPADKILSLDGAAARAEVFMTAGRELGSRALAAALADANLQPNDIGTVIFTSCSVPTIPSLETTIMQHLGFAPTVKRLPIFQYGCAGGAAGLSLACALARGGERVALLSVELCSLIYQGKDRTRGNLVGSALFADGSACLILDGTEGTHGIRHIASSSYLLPESTHLMGYDLLDDGAHLRLDKELPRRLSSEVPAIVGGFLEARNLKPSDVTNWLFHPGGVRILEELERLFALTPAQSRWSWEMLEAYGNMSSASILFVVNAFIRDAARPAGKTLVLGIGPGLTVELLLFDVDSIDAEVVR